MVRKTLCGVRFAALALPIATLCFTAVAPAQRLVLHNHLDDAASVQNSVVGPDLEFSTVTSGLHVVATPAFVEAVERAGLTTTTGNFEVTMHAHNVLLNGVDTLLSPERGTVQLWMRVDEMPIAGIRDNFRAFSGPGDLVEAGIQLFVYDQAGEPTLRFVLRPSFDVVPSHEIVEVVLDYPIQQHLGRWIQVDALWDRQGIDGTLETVRLYVDGAQVASAKIAHWGYHFGASVDIGGIDGLGANAFVVDELRVWDRARLPQFEPYFFTIGEGCAGSAGIPRLDARTGDRPYTGSMFTMCVTSLPDPRWCAVWGLLGSNRDSLFGDHVLPLELGFLGMPGCSIFLQPEFDQQLPNHNGIAEWTLPIPANSQIAGVCFYTQMLVLDASANPFGAIWSNACEGRVGLMQ